MTKLAIIPEPQSVTLNDGQFTLTKDTRIIANAATHAVAQHIVNYLSPATGYDFKIQAEGEHGIRLVLNEGEFSEGYELEVTETDILIQATSPNGLFYGVQTLRQLFPASIESEVVVEDAEWTVPAVSIVDEPRFEWRGMMLDVARHIFEIESVKKLIDLMALYKYNKFHWHLTEDQGWRIDIKQYPRLTEIGSQRAETPIPENRTQGDGIPYGGFYTQDQIREVVAYATDRYMTVIPEIELPGHSIAALTAYPELGCRGEDYQVRTTWGIEEDVYCAGKDEVFTFLENVFTEVLELFPSEYIHIGGDECPKVRWKECPHCQARIQEEGLADEYELQSYFIKRIESWLNEQGRRIVGWDEILEGGLAPNATVMSWRGSDGGIEAANAGHDVVMSPNTNCYFDYYQSEDTEAEGAAIGNYLPLRHVYLFQPIPEDIAPDKAHHILGGQANIWTEYMPTFERVEYMAFPRALALSEVVWSYPEERNFAEFTSRLKQHYARLDNLDVGFRQMKDDD